MKKVEIYKTPICGYCHRTKVLLKRKDVEYTEIDVMRDINKRQEMMNRSGRVTVPQIFIYGQSVGGSGELHALECSGTLDKMLGI